MLTNVDVPLSKAMTTHPPLVKRCSAVVVFLYSSHARMCVILKNIQHCLKLKFLVQWNKIK